MENNEKKTLNQNQLEKVNGGFFVVGNRDSDGRGTSGNLEVTISHYCKECSHSWTADHADSVCPECGGTDIYTVTC